jgi:hypothetical protein
MLFFYLQMALRIAKSIFNRACNNRMHFAFEERGEVKIPPLSSNAFDDWWAGMAARSEHKQGGGGARRCGGHA